MFQMGINLKAFVRPENFALVLGFADAKELGRKP